MTKENILGFLQKKFPKQPVTFIGSGSDSIAFRVGNRVIRVPKGKNATLYLHESEICNAIKRYINFDIPNITVHRGKFLWVEHKMIMGQKWSWHKFMFHPIKQRNLIHSLAQFMAQLHSEKVCNAVKKHIKIPKKQNVYMDYKDVLPYLSEILRPGQLEYFRRHYEKVISEKISDDNMVLCHLGIKGPNSVVDKDGNLSGVFDFCNAGIYERWRDMVLVYLFASRGFYKDFCREYKKLTGVTVDTKRIKDLAAVEFLWTKRWWRDGQIKPARQSFLAKNIAAALAHFHKMPKIMKWWWYYTKK